MTDLEQAFWDVVRWSKAVGRAEKNAEMTRHMFGHGSAPSVWADKAYMTAQSEAADAEGRLAKLIGLELPPIMA